MELDEKTGQGLSKLPRDILRYIATFNHKYSFSYLKENEDLYLIIKYADMTLKCRLECLKYVDQEEMKFDLSNLFKILQGEKVDVKELWFPIPTGNDNLYFSIEKKCFIFRTESMEIKLPSYLTSSLIKILEERANLQICDHCDQPIKDE